MKMRSHQKITELAFDLLRELDNTFPPYHAKNTVAKSAKEVDEKEDLEFVDVEGDHLLMDFGNKEDEARKALAIIKKYKFPRYCFVGRPNPSMTYFRKTPQKPP